MELWSAIAEKTFASGAYNPEAEIAAHCQLTGATVKGSYLRLRGKYQLVLLGARPNLLSQKTETSLVNWLRYNQEGLGYLDMPLSPPRLDFTPSQMERWFTSAEIMSRFSASRSWASEIEMWMMADHNRPDAWNFGPRASHTAFFPLSENWKDKSTRMIDWRTRTLILMRQLERLKSLLRGHPM